MTNKRRANQILWIECVGFLLIVALSWVNEIAQLPRLLFGGSVQSNWRESALESVVILVVWLSVFTATRRVLKRFYYLEERLKMCAWCRRLETGGEWVGVEKHLQKELSATTSNGTCSNCGRQLLSEDALVEK